MTCSPATPFPPAARPTPASASRRAPEPPEFAL